MSTLILPLNPRLKKKSILLRLVCLSAILFLLPMLMAAQTYTFTTAGATGQNGPTQSKVNTAYSSTNLSGKVTVTGGIQYWKVPFTGLYKITVYGAQGYGTYGGRGAKMTGEFLLKGGDVIKILVGQKGAPPVGSSNQYGGGGGTFVVYSTNNTPIIVAGGGGGSWATSFTTTTDAPTTTSGKSGGGTGSTGGAGGTSGGGGSADNSADGGGGFSGDGKATGGGKSFKNGGTGGAGTSSGHGEGGFGGGGGTSSWDNRRGGGGGGYSGGGGAHGGTTGYPEAGGGGSYNSGKNQVNLAGANTGDGKVIIETLSSGAPNDAGVVSIDSPNVYCAGAQNVVATVMNFGKKVLDTVTVNWSVNGVGQTSVKYTGKIDTAGGSGSSTALVTLGSYTFNSSAYTIKVWTTQPNNVSDTVPANDTATDIKQASLPAPTGLKTSSLNPTDATIVWVGGSASNTWEYQNILTGKTPASSGTSVSVDSIKLTSLSPRTSYDFYVREICSGGSKSTWAGPFTYRTPCTGPLNGNYTIDPSKAASSTNFTNIPDVVASLLECGVTGPVKFTFAAGTYNNQIELTPIPGASATNTITFDGVDPTKVTLKNAGTNMTNIATITLDGADYVTIKNMTIQGTGSSYAVGVMFANSADHNTLTDNTITVPTVSSTNIQPIVGTGTTASLTTGDAGDYNLIANNVCRGGYYGIRYYGTSSTSQGMYNRFVGNDVSGFSTYGMYIYYQNYVEILDNKSYKGNGATGSYGCYIYYPHNFTIERNQFIGASYNYLYYANYASPYNSSFSSSFSNNMVVGGSSYGLYFYYGNHLKFQHNSIYVPSGTYGIYGYNAPGNNIDMRNNIIANGNGTAMYLYNSNLDELDYNIYQGSINIGGTVYTNLAAWQSAYPKVNQNSLDMNPGFTSSTDLHLNTSGVKPYGPDLGFTVDVDGDSRCTFAPTIGADESILGKTGRPTAGITVDDTLYTGAPAEVLGNQTPGVAHKNLWYVNGTFVKDSMDLLLTLNTPGTYTIKVIAQGCSLKDSASHTVVVVNPGKKPSPDFIVSENLIKPGETVKFSDLSTGGATQWQWDISPTVTYDANGVPLPTYKYVYGNDSSRVNTVRFDEPGSYKVCLTAVNSKGSATVCKDHYVHVLPVYELSKNTTMTNDSSGFITDDGGPGGNYKANTKTSMVLAPCASEVYLVINKFELECGDAFLRIYDGDDNTGKPLHTCTSNTAANGPGLTGTTGSSCATICMPSTSDTFKALSGKMYIEMATGSKTNSGFEAFWWRKPKNIPAPKASFDFPTTICQDIPVRFTNTTTGDPVGFLWDLDGDMSQFETNSKDASFAYFVPGKYTITLIAVNCGGADTFSQDITVIAPKTPGVSFTADNVNPTTADVVHFSPDIKECVSDYLWRFTPASGSGKAVFMNGTKASSEMPVVNFTDTGCYTVFLYAKNSGGEDSLELSCFIHVKAPYCIPSVSNNVPDIGIGEVSIGSLTKKSSQGIEDYENFVPTDAVNLEQGGDYTLTVKRNSSLNNVSRTAWIDWNLDGDFNDAGEKIGESKNSSALAWALKFTIPTTGKLGASVLRIAINQGNLANTPCGPNKYGEFEDYRVYITPDLTKPVIKLTGTDTVYVEQGYTYTDAGATASDNLDGDITALIKKSVVPTFDNQTPGVYTFKYNVQDSAGNDAETVTRIVIVTVDKTPPQLIVSGTDTVYVAVGDASFTEPQAVLAEDLVDGDLLGEVVRSGNFDISKVGTYTLQFTVSDLTGNTISVNRTIIVQDLIAPVLALVGQDTVYHEVNSPYTEAGATASDNYYGNLAVVLTGNVDVTRPGTYILVYNTTDSSGNKATPLTRVVIVRDTKAPLISLKDDSVMTVEVFSQFVDPGVETSDNYGTPVVTQTGTFYATFPGGKPDVLGDYTIIYTATDSFGNSAMVTRTVRVQDTEAPGITLDGPPSANVCRWSDYKDAGYTVTDNYWKGADITVTSDGNFENTLQEGVYSLRYKAVDKSGNVAYSGWRIINVLPAGEGACASGIASGDLDKNITVYPNPTRGQVYVSVELPQTQVVTLTVTNALGEVVARANNENILSKTFKIDLSGQAAGVYLVHISAGKQLIVKKIIMSN